jgi:hypothetical protein
MPISEIPGAVKAGLTLTEKIFSWWTDEAGRIAIQKRARLRAKKEECAKALKENRLDDLRRLTAELERLSVEA